MPERGHISRYVVWKPRFPEAAQVTHEGKWPARQRLSAIGKRMQAEAIRDGMVSLSSGNEQRKTQASLVQSDTSDRQTRSQ